MHTNESAATVSSAPRRNHQAPDRSTVGRDLLEQIWNRENHAALLQSIPADYVVREAAVKRRRHGPFALLDVVNAYKAIVPDLTFRCEDERETNHGTTTAWSAAGRHDGVVPGLRPTGRTVRLDGVLTIARQRPGSVTAVSASWAIDDFIRQVCIDPDAFAQLLNPAPADVVMRAVQSASGPATVLFPTMSLPGWMTWRHLIDVLKRQKPIVTFQLLANRWALARRSKPRSYSVRSETGAVRRALDRSGMRGPFDLVGHSAGGTLALDFALEYPGDVRSLTLIEPGPAWVLETAGPLSAASRRFLDEQRATYSERMTEAAYAAYIRKIGVLPAGVEPEAVPDWRLFCAYRGNMRFRAALHDHTDDPTRLRSAQFPVLLIRGTESHSYFHEIVDVLSARLPDARVIDLPGGHAPHEREGALPFLRSLTAFHHAVSTRE